MRIITVLLVLCVTSPAFAGASAWFPFEIENSQIILPITLNGEPAKALLDSGATGNAIAMSYLESHEGEFARGAAITVTGVHGEIHTSFINNMQIGMFGTEFGIDQLMPFRGDHYDFIIGLPFFQLFIVQIDYPGQRLRIVSHDSLDMKKFSNVKMKRSTNSGQALVKVDMNGEYSPWLTLDTGNNSGILLQRTQAERLGWLEQYDSESTGLMGISGEGASIDVFTLPMMTIGPFEMEDVMVMVPGKGETLNLRDQSSKEWSTGTRIKRGKTSHGILGYDVLKHFIVTIDFKRSLLNLDVPR